MIQVLLFWVECLIVLMVFNLGIWVIGYNYKWKEGENGFFQYWFLLNCMYQLILLNFGLCMWFKIEKIFSWNFRYSRFGYISGWLEFKFRVFDDQVYGYPDLFLFFMDDQVCDFFRDISRFCMLVCITWWMELGWDRQVLLLIGDMGEALLTWMAVLLLYPCVDTISCDGDQ